MTTGYMMSGAGEYLCRVAGLVEDEARSNLFIGIARTIQRSPEVYPDHDLFVVDRSGTPVAAALVTHPANLVLADAADDRAVAFLARYVLESGVPIPGVTGNRPTVDRFVASWSEHSGEEARIAMRQGVFSLESVTALDPAPGVARKAVMGDRDLIVEWSLEFADEDHDAATMVELVERRLSPGGRSGFWLWIDRGEVVSLSGHGGPTRSGIRIGPVYTPPAFRGCGYATSLVTHQSRRLLEDGHRFCFL